MNKNVFLYLLILVPLCIFSQSASIQGSITEQEMQFAGVNVTLLRDGKIIQSVQTNLEGKYFINIIESGKYDLKLTYAAMRDEIIPVDLKDGINIYNLIYPKPCLPIKKVCPQGHTNAIIPIVYGYPSEKTIKKAKMGKLKLGGCDSSLCERWHCNIHDIDF